MGREAKFRKALSMPGLLAEMRRCFEAVWQGEAIYVGHGPAGRAVQRDEAAEIAGILAGACSASG